MRVQCRNVEPPGAIGGMRPYKPSPSCGVASKSAPTRRDRRAHSLCDCRGIGKTKGYNEIRKRVPIQKGYTILPARRHGGEQRNIKRDSQPVEPLPKAGNKPEGQGIPYDVSVAGDARSSGNSGAILGRPVRRGEVWRRLLFPDRFMSGPSSWNPGMGLWAGKTPTRYG